MMRVAACQYPIEPVATMAAWEQKVTQWTAEAADADVLLFPEYASMELTAALDARDLPSQLLGMQMLWPAYVATWLRLAQLHATYIVAPSFPLRIGTTYCNVAPVIAPTGAVTLVPKLQMTRFEAETWGIAAGREQFVFATAAGRFGIAICYDIEFPLIARRLARAGADVILVPSATDTLAGYHRVRIGAQARALENQRYVVQSPTVGEAPWSIAMDANIGAAGIYAPPDTNQPATGIVAQGELNRPMWVTATLDLAAAAHTRRDGQVLVDRDWDLPAHLDTTVTQIPAA